MTEAFTDPSPLHPWPNDVSIAIIVTEKIQRAVFEELKQKHRDAESIIELDDAYRMAPDLAQTLTDVIKNRWVPDYVTEFLDQEEASVAEMVIQQLPPEQLDVLKEEFRRRLQE